MTRQLWVGSRFVIGLAFLGVLEGTPSWAVSLLKTVPVGHGPTQVVVDPAAHNTYVVNSSSNSVSVLDSQTLKVKKTIAVGNSPVAIAANPPASMVYVANSGSGTISEITGVKAAVTWTVGGTPMALAVDSALDQLYVADSSANRILILDSAQGTVLQTLSIDALPTAMAVNIATHDLWVACTGASGSVVVIDGTLKQIVKTVGSLPTGASSIALDPITNVAMVVSPTANTYTAINAASNYSVTIQPGDITADPIAAAYDPDSGTGLFFVADTGDGNIFFCLGDGLFHLGNAFATHMSGAGALAINPTTNQMGLAYPTADTAYIINLLNPLFTQNYFFLTPGVTPTGPAFDPLANKFFVTNKTDNTVSVFDDAPEDAVPAYEANDYGLNVDYNFTDTNPATGITYTLRLGDLYAINEAQAGAGYDGSGMNTAGVTEIPLGSTYSESLVVNPATNRIYVGDGSDLFYSINGATNVATLVSGMPAFTRFRSLAVDYATNQILGWDYGNSKVLVLDGATNQVLQNIPVPNAGFAPIFVDPVRNLAYLGTCPVSVIDPSTGTIVATVPITGSAIAADFNRTANRLYVATNSATVYVIDTTQNSLAATVTIPAGSNIYSMGANPLTGNYYVGTSNSTGFHVLVYSGTSNTLLLDLSSTDHPEITEPIAIVANPLTNTMLVGSDFFALTTSSVVTIDGLTNVVSTLLPSSYEYLTHSVAVDLGTNVIAAGGTSYTTLWFPNSDPTGDSTVPIAVSLVGVKDASTITSKPIFRTRNVQPSFNITATSNYSQNANLLIPQHGFYQVDGRQGTWTPLKLKPKNGTNSSTAKVQLSTLTTGRHILYAYATDSDVATVQSSTVNSPVISPVGAVVFTVEK